jgi:putative ABC transport system permease protein
MYREYLGVALRALRANRFRSLLTVSSITLGAFSIVLMSSLAQSGLTTLARDIEELGGARIIMIAPKKAERSPKKGGSPGYLTTRDRDQLFAALPHLKACTMFSTLDRHDISNDQGNTGRTDFVAADAGFFRAFGLRLAKGRLFTPEDVKQHARVCVVAYDVAKLLWEGEAVGNWLTIGDQRCEVIGQLAKVDHWDSNFGFAWLDFAAMPLDSAAETNSGVLEGAAILMQTEDVAYNDVVKRIANAILSERHRGVDDFQIWDFNRFMAQFHTMFALMEAVVGLIAGVALVVGGIGVMNMMLVSVSERTREIGVRKALGAGPAAISAQFLFEAGTLAGLGGLSGTVAGVSMALLTNALIARAKELWVSEISLVAVAVALISSVAIGLVFGFFPARAASRLDPVVAMRR